jgi:hypothetical protein
MIAFKGYKKGAMKWKGNMKLRETKLRKYWNFKNSKLQHVNKILKAQLDLSFCFLKLKH